MQAILKTFANLIIVDLGGTLAHRGERPKESYVERFLEDRIDITVRELLTQVKTPDTAILIMTGQREKGREITEQWLKIHGVTYDLLLMKPNDDKRDTLIWKRDVFVGEIMPFIHTKYILEDREDTVDMWRNLGVRCFQTASGQDREYYGRKYPEVYEQR